MGQLRREGDHLVVLLRRRDGDAAEARRGQQRFDLLQKRYVVVPGRDDDHRRAVEEIAPGVF